MRSNNCVDCGIVVVFGDEGGKRIRCDECRKIVLRKRALDRYRKNPVEARAVSARWRSRNKDKIKQYARFNSVRHIYGLTFEQFDVLVKEHNGRCYICQRTPNRELDVDHDHRTKQVRKLLCNRCNRLVGLIEEGGFELAGKVVDYLRSFKCQRNQNLNGVCSL